jgi:ABC-type polysaccharide/polyol phosphate transport system ATPase subunit
MKRTSDDIAIELSNISKRYEIHHEKPTLVEKFVNGRNESFWALNDINLSIRKGERVGLIGPNGSGKTTMLKIIAGITSPTSGTVSVRGRIVSLIDLEAGFQPDLTGIENIYLSGMLLGMRKYEINHKIRTIINFADIGQFLDAPIFTYSEGMKLRLGFAIAVSTNPDILILDEGFVTGDENFQKKSTIEINRLFHKGKTILMVNHWLEFIKQRCQRIILLHKGNVVRDGGKNVVDYYTKHAQNLV